MAKDQSHFQAWLFCLMIGILVELGLTCTTIIFHCLNNLHVIVKELLIGLIEDIILEALLIDKFSNWDSIHI